MAVEFIIPEWEAPPNIKAFTSTRLGGVSHEPYQSLNVGDHVDDAAELVDKNRQLLIKEVQSEFGSKIQPLWLKQEHTTNIATNQDVKHLSKQAFDGFITQQKQVVCTIMTADCLPVFICNKAGTQVALVHARAASWQ